MGTRNLTVMVNGNKNAETETQEIAVLYRQMDGYPSGHGAELADFLKPYEIVNGFGFTKEGEEPPKVFNGPDCMAASIVAHFKDGVGNFYLYPAGTRDCWENYIYIVTAYSPIDEWAEAENDAPAPAEKERAGHIWLKVSCVEGTVLYDGPIRDYTPED